MQSMPNHNRLHANAKNNSIRRKANLAIRASQPANRHPTAPPPYRVREKCRAMATSTRRESSVRELSGDNSANGEPMT